jgi:hypothetical protein
MPVKVSHSESWTLRITPADGEVWEDIRVSWRGEAGRKVIPAEIVVVITRGGRRPAVVVKGHDRLKAGGAGTALRTINTWDLPPWVEIKVSAAITAEGLTPDVTGCG